MQPPQQQIKFEDLWLNWLYPLARDSETPALGLPLTTVWNHHSGLMMTASDLTMENALIRLPAVNIGITAPGAGENTPEETVTRESSRLSDPVMHVVYYGTLMTYQVLMISVTWLTGVSLPLQYLVCLLGSSRTSKHSEQFKQTPIYSRLIVAWI